MSKGKLKLYIGLSILFFVVLINLLHAWNYYDIETMNLSEFYIWQSK